LSFDGAARFEVSAVNAFGAFSKGESASAEKLLGFSLKSFHLKNSMTNTYDFSSASQLSRQFKVYS
jgi:hypothetical protein